MQLVQIIQVEGASLNQLFISTGAAPRWRTMMSRHGSHPIIYRPGLRSGVALRSQRQQTTVLQKLGQ